VIIVVDLGKKAEVRKTWIESTDSTTELPIIPTYAKIGTIITNECNV
jgi:hypothetical protein